MSGFAKRIIPLMDRVLVQRVKPIEKTASGIIIPEEARRVTNEATVLAVGPGALAKDGTRVPMSVTAGDKVLLPEYGGSAFKLEDEELNIYRESELIAKVNH